jgi:two-component system cell cycle sensor histidine kinase/response regulator CckA
LLTVPRKGMKLRILHVEDSENDSEIIRQLLLKDGITCEIERQETQEEFVDRLQANNYDLIFADCRLPGFTGMRALDLARQYAPATPFIFISGSMGEDSAIESLRNGATDYVLKGRLSRLVPAVRRAILEAKERERSLDMERRLRQTQNLETVGTLAGGIAHDFNNILTIIKGHAALLDREAFAPDRVLEISAVIDHAARRGADLVKQMLAFAHKSEGIFSPTDFNQLVRLLTDMLRETVSRNLRFEFRLDETLPVVMADGPQIERVVINLVNNARDAMPNGGCITFSTERITESTSVPCLADLPRQEYLLLSVADNGTGMDEATRRRIFEPFFTTKARGKGTGLGMPVVYGLMQMHHGTIDVTSQPNQGTTVRLYFPIVTKCPEPPKQEAAPSTTRSGGTETLLVVDDEPDVISFLRLLLESEGYKVLAAENAEEATAIFKEHRDEISLLFSDLGLPTASGFELAKTLQRLKPGLKSLLASGYADAEFKQQLQRHPSTAFISKPYSPEVVLAAIRAALDEGSFLPTATGAMKPLRSVGAKA